jgi:hypothetical protein
MILNCALSFLHCNITIIIYFKRLLKLLETYMNDYLLNLFVCMIFND